MLSELKPFSKWFESQVKQEDAEQNNVTPDLLDLCHILPNEVINLSGGGKGYNVDPDADEEEYAAFRVSESLLLAVCLFRPLSGNNVAPVCSLIQGIPEIQKE